MHAAVQRDGVNVGPDETYSRALLYVNSSANVYNYSGIKLEIGGNGVHIKCDEEGTLPLVHRYAFTQQTTI